MPADFEFVILEIDPFRIPFGGPYLVSRRRDAERIDQDRSRGIRDQAARKRRFPHARKPVDHANHDAGFARFSASLRAMISSLAMTQV